MARSAPSLAQPNAIARPIPLDAPVTSTIFPSSLTPPPPARSPTLTSRIPTYQRHGNSQGAGMRLLVSVRSAGEVEAAVEGGAEIIDAKEPMRGSLGAVDAAELARIADAVTVGMPLSIAMGDCAAPASAATGMDLLRAVARRPAELYVKVGVAGVNQLAAARSVLEAVVGAARGSPFVPEVVAVAY